MAKRIEFIAPVDSMRGNLSGSQDLVYAANDNKAYESPANQVNYAKNYRTSYVGAKRASDGLKFFGVKTKTATHTTQAAMTAMALMGATGVLFNLFKEAGARGNDQRWGQVVYNYENSFKKQYKSLRQYAMDVIRKALVAKKETIVFGGPTVATYQNPWISKIEDAIWQMSFLTNFRKQGLVEIIHKFASVLGPSGTFIYKVNAQNGVTIELVAITGVAVAQLYAGLPNNYPYAFGGYCYDSLGNRVVPDGTTENFTIGGVGGALSAKTVYSVEGTAETVVPSTDSIDPTFKYICK